MTLGGIFWLNRRRGSVQRSKLGRIPNWGHSELWAQLGHENQPACVCVFVTCANKYSTIQHNVVCVCRATILSPGTSTPWNEYGTCYTNIRVDVILCTEAAGQRNDIELILTVKIETKYPVDGSFANEFSSISSHCGFIAAWSRKTFENSCKIYAFKKMTPDGEILKILF